MESDAAKRAKARYRAKASTKAKHAAYMRAYRARPEVKARMAELRALALATETPEEREERLAYRRMIDAMRKEARR
jgi:hypothetical protein